MAGSDPQTGLRQVITIFCDFWSFDAAALGVLYAAAANDLELDASMRERNERRRHLLTVLVRRIAKGRYLRTKKLGDLVDVLLALTSFPFFSQLTAEGRSAEAAGRLNRRTRDGRSAARDRAIKRPDLSLLTGNQKVAYYDYG